MPSSVRWPPARQNELFLSAAWNTFVGAPAVASFEAVDVRFGRQAMRHAGSNAMTCTHVYAPTKTGRPQFCPYKNGKDTEISAHIQSAANVAPEQCAERGDDDAGNPDTAGGAGSAAGTARKRPAAAVSGCSAGAQAAGASKRQRKEAPKLQRSSGNNRSKGTTDC